MKSNDLVGIYGNPLRQLVKKIFGFQHALKIWKIVSRDFHYYNLLKYGSNVLKCFFVEQEEGECYDENHKIEP